MLNFAFFQNMSLANVEKGGDGETVLCKGGHLGREDVPRGEEKEARGRKRKGVRRRGGSSTSLTRRPRKTRRCSTCTSSPLTFSAPKKASRRAGKQAGKKAAVVRADPEPDDVRLCIWGAESGVGGEECSQKSSDPAFPDRSTCNLSGSRCRWRSITGYLAHLRRAHPDLAFCVLGRRVYIRRRRQNSLASDVADGLTVVWIQSTLGLSQEFSQKGEAWDEFRWKCLSLICGADAEEILQPILDQALTWAKPVPVGDLDQHVALTSEGKAQCGLCHIIMGSWTRVRTHLEDVHLIDPERHACRYAAHYTVDF